MCGNYSNFGSLWIIIILILLFGCNGWNNGCGCGCGCNNGCGCDNGNNNCGCC